MNERRPTGAERYLAGRLNDPEYREHYEQVMSSPFGPLSATADLWPDRIDWAALIDRTVRRLALTGLTVAVALGAGGAAILMRRRHAR